MIGLEVSHGFRQISYECVKLRKKRHLQRLRYQLFMIHWPILCRSTRIKSATMSDRRAPPPSLGIAGIS
jgi:hypothetical protein